MPEVPNHQQNLDLQGGLEGSIEFHFWSQLSSLSYSNQQQEGKGMAIRGSPVLRLI